MAAETVTVLLPATVRATPDSVRPIGAGLKEMLLLTAPEVAVERVTVLPETLLTVVPGAMPPGSARRLPVPSWRASWG